MTFYVNCNGETIERRLDGPCTLAEVLTRSEYERVRQGSLFAMTATGGVMSLSSPLYPGQLIALRQELDTDVFYSSTGETR